MGKFKERIEFKNIMFLIQKRLITVERDPEKELMMQRMVMKRRQCLELKGNLPPLLAQAQGTMMRKN